MAIAQNTEHDMPSHTDEAIKQTKLYEKAALDLMQIGIDLVSIKAIPQSKPKRTRKKVALKTKEKICTANQNLNPSHHQNPRIE